MLFVLMTVFYAGIAKKYTGTRLDPIEYIKKYEGTFDMWSGLSTCTDCYLRIEMPSKKELFYHSYPTFRLRTKKLKPQNNYELKKLFYKRFIVQKMKRSVN